VDEIGHRFGVETPRIVHTRGRNAGCSPPRRGLGTVLWQTNTPATPVGIDGAGTIYALGPNAKELRRDAV